MRGSLIVLSHSSEVTPIRGCVPAEGTAHCITRLPQRQFATPSPCCGRVWTCLAQAEGVTDARQHSQRLAQARSSAAAHAETRGAGRFLAAHPQSPNKTPLKQCDGCGRSSGRRLHPTLSARNPDEHPPRIPGEARDSDLNTAVAPFAILVVIDSFESNYKMPTSIVTQSASIRGFERFSKGLRKNHAFGTHRTNGRVPIYLYYLYY